jgi:hypothetical protein
LEKILVESVGMNFDFGVQLMVFADRTFHRLPPLGDSLFQMTFTG